MNICIAMLFWGISQLAFAQPFAPPVFHIEGPDIPGVRLFDAGPGIIAFTNESQQKIIGLSIDFYYDSGHKVSLYIDGLDFEWSGVGTGQTVSADPHGMNAAGTTISYPTVLFGDTDGTVQVVSIGWVLWADGTFSGDPSVADRLNYRAKVRAQFFRDVSGRLDPDKYVTSLRDCMKEVSCMKAGGQGSKYWNEIGDALQRYKIGHMGSMPKELESARRISTRYPLVKVPTVVQRRFTSQLFKPESFSDGWYIANFYGTAFNGWPGTVCRATWQTPCEYSSPFNVQSQGFASGYEIEPPVDAAGFGAQYKAECDNYLNIFVIPPHDMKAGLIIDKYFPTPGVTPALSAVINPGHVVESEIQVNFNEGMDGWLGDKVTFSFMYQYSQPWGTHANDVAGSSTACTVTDQPNFFNPLGSTLLTAFNTYFNYWQTAGITTSEAASPGFPIANFKVSENCAGAKTVTALHGIQTPNHLYPDNTSFLVIPTNDLTLKCYHEIRTAVANNDGQCDALNDFCCCMATYNNLTQCLNYGLPQTDYCPGNVGASGYKVASDMVTVTSSKAGTTAPVCSYGMANGVCINQPAPVTQLGIYRGSTRSILQDTNFSNAFEQGQDRFVGNFANNIGGMNSGDIMVAGDWTGDHRTKLGFYRPTTGQWFLDTLNTGNVNVTYNFGGLAGDKPFVGDWSGGGKDCIGIYRGNGSVWLLDLNCNGQFDNTPIDAFFPFGGIAGDVPVVGKWFGGATTKVGVVRKWVDPYGQPQGDPFFWVFDANPAYAGNDPSNHPAAPGAFAFGGLAGDKFVSGDWAFTGYWRAAVYRNGTWLLDYNGSHQYDAAHTFNFGGLAGDVPLPGRW